MGKKPVTSAQHICGRCAESFNSRQALNRHLQNHEDTKPTSHKCPVCPFFFEDSLALEQHCILSNHWEPAQYKCDRCTQTFDIQREFNRHREHGQPCCDALHSKDWKRSPYLGYVDPDQPSLVSREVQELAYGGDSPGTPSYMSDGQEYCHCCKKVFASGFAYDCHILRCTALNSTLVPDSPPETPRVPDQSQNAAPTSPTIQRHTVTVEVPPFRATKSTTLAKASPQTVTLNTKAPVPCQPLQTSMVQKDESSAKVRGIHVPAQAAIPLQARTTSSHGTGTGPFVCNIKGCQRSYKSEPGLKMHQTDAHGVGGNSLDLYGRDAWMLGQRECERLKAEGLLRITTGPTRGGNNNHGGSRGGRTAPAPVANRVPLPAAPGQHAPVTEGPYRQVSHHNDINIPPLIPTSQNIGGVLEMEQAKSICRKTLRLLLQSDIFIHHDGKISISGINWTRIGVERQLTVVGMFNEMCHLPPSLQAIEYVPTPKTFMADYTAQYPVTEFKSAPARNPAKPGLGIISIACSMITLSNGCEEIVKIAAIDVLNCRVLMGHLVCTNPNARIANWHSSVTGLSSFRDMEDARQAGYRVLKGWTAARSALFEFIDKDTIIVGHNLRSELDALRIIHGRAVDIAKVVEKAAQGPLSKAQVSLDSWCRDVANIARLKTDPVFGRDCIMSAFAAREIGLWSIKNREKFEKVARQKTQEYQLVIRA